MKLLHLTLSLAVLFLLAAAVSAGDGTKKNKNVEGIQGMVTKVNPVAKSFTFRVGKKKDASAKEITVQFDKNTKFVKQGVSEPEDADISDLAVRTRVVIVYDTTEAGKNLATKVTILLSKK
jgi:hypothetical protein